ncbi:hydrolase 76 protein [Puccinia graminis f. sp. tritici]|uniref:Mannan endo-1,6-alpha-mannosidase n=1 Tax=Puccinia graminis f. sp. tritici TaxID=56615 RepID=A0A5B0QB10_PUCGR|nr:hydrolase 76 protein [Puccinia graminis f. sp. tritici]
MILNLRRLTRCLFLSSTLAPSFTQAVSLDVNDLSALKNAASTALKNLMSFYTPNPSGVFDQASTPWHESGMIWGLFMDYAKYTGDTQFLDVVTGALVNASYGAEQDLLGGAMSSTAATLLGRWNDDILWHSLATVGGAEIYGAESIMPGSKGSWMTLAQKTYDQTYQQWDNGCGGGIYWSRDRNGASAPYKSLITQLEFIQQGARNFMENKNNTALDLSKAAMDWVFSSGLGNAQTGILYDGMNVGECGKFTTHLWSYNYGSLLGALAWMHKATGNNTYLDLIGPFYNYASQTFSGQNVSNVVTETCEPGARCNRDQQGFKAVYLRNLAYTYREASSDSIKNSIKTTVDASVAAMVQNSCDNEWFCNGNWTADASPVKYVRSQHVSAALLVSALGIHLNPEGGLLPKITPGQLVDTTNGAAGLGSGGTKNPGKVTSKPLAAAPGLSVTFSSLFFGLFIAVISSFSPLDLIPS